MKLLGHKLTGTALFGFVVLLLYVLIAVLAPFIAPYGEAEIVGKTWTAASSTSWLGTDQIGRDILTRMIYGARNTIALAIVITLLSFTVGILSGLLASTVGIFDTVLSRVVDVMLSIPSLIFALILIGAFGNSLVVLVVTIAILDSTRVFRLARSLGLNLVVMEYVEAARLRGEGLWWIITKEILPNSWAPLISELGLRFCFNFLFIAALAFLGLGIQPPSADWGSMVRENAQVIAYGNLTPLYPAAAIALLTVAVNLVVDWMLSIDARPSGAQAEL